MTAPNEKRVINSFKKPAPPPAPAAPPAPLPPVAGLGGLAGIPVRRAAAPGPSFLPAGTVLTDFEKEGLKALGVSPTGPIPTDLAARIAAAQKDLAGPVPLPVAADTPPMKMPPVVNVADLPEGKRREIADSLAAARSALADRPAAADPSPRAAAPHPARPAPVELVNDLAPDMTGPAALPPAAPAAAPSAGGALDVHPTNCSHCGHDLNVIDTTPITDDDKLNFVQSILGGQRFKKRVALLGGRLRLVFRSLTSSESDTAFRQVLVDAQADLRSRLVSDTQFYWRNLSVYRMVMALESIESDQFGAVELPPLADIEVDDDAFTFPDTKLAAVADKIVTAVLPVEALRAMVGHAFNEFQAVCDKLQVMAEDPGFWKAIA